MNYNIQSGKLLTTDTTDTIDTADTLGFGCVWICSAYRVHLQSRDGRLNIH